jgi:hypothetical protein
MHNVVGHNINPTDVVDVPNVALAIDETCRANDLVIALPQRTLWVGESSPPDDLFG